MALIYVGLKARVPVVEFELRPGHLAPAGRFPSKDLPAHPFLNVRALEPAFEETLIELIHSATDGPDFKRRLEAAGLEIREVGQP